MAWKEVDELFSHLNAILPFSEFGLSKGLYPKMTRTGRGSFSFKGFQSCDLEAISGQGESPQGLPRLLDLGGGRKGVALRRAGQHRHPS